MKIVISTVLVSLFALVCCVERNSLEVRQTLSDDQYKIQLLQVGDSAYRIVSVYRSDTSTWDFDYPVFKMLYSDIDNDGEKEIVVGVIKATRFDPEVRKRVFVFKHYDHKIRPEWLGSALGMPLQNFSIESRGTSSYLISIGIEQDSTYSLGKFEWHKFGFRFVKYIARHKTKNEIQQLGYEI